MATEDEDMTPELLLKISLLVMMVATVGALILGLFPLFKEERAANKQSNKMMRLRIVFQGLAIFIFSILLFLKGK